MNSVRARGYPRDVVRRALEEAYSEDDEFSGPGNGAVCFSIVKTKMKTRRLLTEADASNNEPSPNALFSGSQPVDESAQSSVPRSVRGTASPSFSFGESTIAVPSPAATSTIMSPTENTRNTTKRRPPKLDILSTVPRGLQEGPLSARQTDSPKRQRKTSNSPSNTYFCTSCPSSFDTAIAWKDHEEKVHERHEKYPCPNPSCSAVFFDPDVFKRHHKETHGCGRCGHAANVVQTIYRSTRGYGCGICEGFFSSQSVFLEHVELHWEAGLTRRDWKHSKVINGLLKRPGVREAWVELLWQIYPDQRMLPGFYWDVGMTGRDAGAESGGHGLQDALEMLGEIPGLGAAGVARMAHDLARPIPREEVQRMYSRHEPGCRTYQLGEIIQKVIDGMNSSRLPITQQPQLYQSPNSQPPYYAQGQPQQPHRHLQPQTQQQMAALSAGIPSNVEQWGHRSGMSSYLSPSPMLQRQPQQQQMFPPPVVVDMTRKAPDSHYSPSGHVPQVPQPSLSHQYQDQHHMSGPGMFMDPSQQRTGPNVGTSDFASPNLPDQFSPFPQQQQQHGHHTPDLMASPNAMSDVHEDARHPHEQVGAQMYIPVSGPGSMAQTQRMDGYYPFPTH
jgi:hypothetical protein